MPKAVVLGGDTGLLGQALVRSLQAQDWEVLSLGRAAGDLCSPDFLKDAITKANADVIFNTIAWTQVDAAEEHMEEAYELNRAFPDSLARILSKLDKGHLVHYSTDFVFSGENPEPWKEDDMPEPKSVYGTSKLAGEKAVLDILPDRACVIRTAWLFGPGRKNFITTILNACKNKDMISVVDDQYGSPTYTEDLADWSLLLASKGVTGIWHGVNSGRASWCELAQEAINLVNYPCRIEPIPSSEWPQKAKRPPFSILDNSKLSEFIGKKPRPWPQALRDYIFSWYLPREENQH